MTNAQRNKDDIAATPSLPQHTDLLLPPRSILSGNAPEVDAFYVRSVSWNVTKHAIWEQSVGALKSLSTYTHEIDTRARGGTQASPTGTRRWTAVSFPRRRLDPRCLVEASRGDRHALPPHCLREARRALPSGGSMYARRSAGAAAQDRHKIRDMGRIRTRDLLLLSRTCYRYAT
ncbi:hypothetical protein Bbelb_026040 [Branchiostoma belcheri]|nr:hypothetical protein Bbelb_026040 [Branchiostoma belcheri]